MSWQLLVPIAEQLVKAGIEYMNTDSVEQGAVAPTPEPVVEVGSTVLLTLRGDTENLKDKLRAAINSIAGVEVVLLEVTDKPKESNTNV